MTMVGAETAQHITIYSHTFLIYQKVYIREFEITSKCAVKDEHSIKANRQSDCVPYYFDSVIERGKQCTSEKYS